MPEAPKRTLPYGVGFNHALERLPGHSARVRAGPYAKVPPAPSRQSAASAKEAGDIAEDLLALILDLTRLDEIRWLLEVPRVSLFAQQLGTVQPVSVKRIEARWRELGL